jgi:tripartite-type tricarboxylate transporter receptor subunit TctC
MATVGDNLTVTEEVEELFAQVLGEAPALRDHNLLVSRELGTSTAEGLKSIALSGVLGSDGVDDVSTSDTSGKTVRLTISTTHTSLESIGTSTGKHLVDTQNVERMHTDTHVEAILTTKLNEVLVAANTSGFESFGGDLMMLAGQKMDAEGEFGNIGALLPQIENADLRLGNTTAETRLDIRFATDGAITASGTYR